MRGPWLQTMRAKVIQWAVCARRDGLWVDVGTFPSAKREQALEAARLAVKVKGTEQVAVYAGTDRGRYLRFCTKSNGRKLRAVK